MLKTLTKLFVSNMAAILVLIANYGAGPNSVFVWYEPNVPISLKK